MGRYILIKSSEYFLKKKEGDYMNFAMFAAAQAALRNNINTVNSIINDNLGIWSAKNKKQKKRKGKKREAAFVNTSEEKARIEIKDSNQDNKRMGATFRRELEEATDRRELEEATDKTDKTCVTIYADNEVYKTLYL